jgi:hypothetical protein
MNVHAIDTRHLRRDTAETPEGATILPLRTWGFLRKSMPHPARRELNGVGLDPVFFEGEGVYRATLSVPSDGSVVLNLVCPRPLRLHANGVLVFDHPLTWHSFHRRLTGLVVLPVVRGELELLVEVGPRPKHPSYIDECNPSRNRAMVMRQVLERFPDRFDLCAEHCAAAGAPAVSMRFELGQFREEGVVYQHVVLQDLQPQLDLPSYLPKWSIFQPVKPAAFALRTRILPHAAREITTDRDRIEKWRRFAVPVASPSDGPPPLRGEGADDRAEPSIEIARWLELGIEGGAGAITVRMPGYESLGRQAPRQEFRELKWPGVEELLGEIPMPILPPALSRFMTLYIAAWKMLLDLVRAPDKESGAINSYISTGSGFQLYQFVWDSSFASMAASYGWRVLPAYAQLDNLYSRQFDGGYIHRDTNWEHGVPEIYEPDFSPNPPIMTIAEWQIARLSGNLDRLRKVFPVLRANHQWIWHNRRLADGTFWTTGLANGLDNSPSLGDGYPDLSAQMAHEAGVLAAMASILGLTEDAELFHRQKRETGEAVNLRLWDDTQKIYSTSLPGGGHNPNKVVTAFWPLWAGIVNSERTENLARHLMDPRSFWRHHPIPSLAADSPHFSPRGDYWMGSVWAPTNYAAIKGFDCAGRHDLAVKTTLRHLDCLADVLETTGHFWENYCSEKSVPGNSSGKSISWTALGPICLLLEVVIGLEPDALRNSVTWTLPDHDNIGVRNYPLGSNTLSLRQQITDGQLQLHVDARLPFTLEVVSKTARQSFECPAGVTTLRPVASRA